jgi:hypothetical protein
MMRRLILLVALSALATAATAQPPEWVARIGVTNNSYPGGGSDNFNYFGAYPESIDDYPDRWDVVDPGYPDHAVALIFRGDQYGDNPTYPEGGLSWDIREPYSDGYKVWKIELVSTDEGYTYDLLYKYDAFGGYPLPDGWICRLDRDGEINGANYLDLSLYEFDLNHKEGEVLRDIPQSGGSETWYVIAGIPEPGLTTLVGLGVACGLVFRPRHRR